VRLFARLRHQLSYANVMATIAVFVALGGGAYAVSVPRNSVGPSQLKRNAVSAKKIKRGAVSGVAIKDRSLGPRDFRAGVLPTGAAAARADDMDPPSAPGTVLKQVVLDTKRAGRIYVHAPMREIFLTCGSVGACSVHWGVYVDNVPVPDAGVRLDGAPGLSNGFTYHTLFGVTAPLPAGHHVVKLARSQAGPVESGGELGVQLGAFELG
jgi:hypothetical protein